MMAEHDLKAWILDAARSLRPSWSHEQCQEIVAESDEAVWEAMCLAGFDRLAELIGTDAPGADEFDEFDSDSI
jgi:hypothetical protein